LLRVFVNLLTWAAAGWLAGCAAVSGPAGVDRDTPAYPRDAMRRYERGLGYMQAGADLRATEIFSALTDDYPGYAGPLVNLGIIHRRNGAADEAGTVLAKAVSVCTDCAAAWNELGILQRQTGLFESAEQSYLRAIEADPAYSLAYLNLGVLYELYQRRLPQALEYYEKFIATSGDERRVEEVRKWIADLKRRAPSGRTAHNGG